MKTSIDLLANASATGSAKTAVFGGRYLMLVQGTFDGVTVAVEILGPDGTNYITVPDSAKTAAGAAVIYLPADAQIRGAISGGEAPQPAIYLSLHYIETSGG